MWTIYGLLVHRIRWSPPRRLEQSSPTGLIPFTYYSSRVTRLHRKVTESYIATMLHAVHPSLVYFDIRNGWLTSVYT